MQTEVYLNGKFVGYTDDAPRFCQQVRTERRKGAISNIVNIHLDLEANRIMIEG
ncbi:MAG: hypothetical protein AABY13_04105, partial [Nanoarchaeota archaeon]